MDVFDETRASFGKLETISGNYEHFCENVEDIEVNY